MRVLFQVFLIAVIGGWTASGQDLWKLSREKRFVHRFSTLFTAQDVRDYLSTEERVAEAVSWCRQTGVTKVYLGTYRDKYQAERETLVRARDRLRAAGLLVAGVITTTQIGKISTGSQRISCYTNQGTQTALRSIVEHAAGIFDEIVLDDNWFTDCVCEECDAARKEQQVQIRVKTFPVASTSWEDYRSELMERLARSHIIGAAKRTNPEIKVSLKYPRWYDVMHERGYDVLRATKTFDGIWAGTEMRDPDFQTTDMQYRGYFLMRWLGGIGGRKMAGGWFDSRQSSEKTYLEQARQTILGGAKETMLSSYGALQENFGPENIESLRLHIPELLDVATEVGQRTPDGIAAYKPPASHPEDEMNIYDVAGMLGLPLKPFHEFPEGEKAAFFPIQSVKDPLLIDELNEYIATGRPVLVTDALARRISSKANLAAENVDMLSVGGRPASLLGMSQQQLDELRAPLLKALGVAFRAPASVSLYLFTDGSWVIENFSDQRATVELDGQAMMIGPREWVYHWAGSK